MVPQTFQPDLPDSFIALFCAYFTGILIFSFVKYKWASNNESDMKIADAQNLCMIHPLVNIKAGFTPTCKSNVFFRTQMSQGAPQWPRPSYPS